MTDVPSQMFKEFFLPRYSLPSSQVFWKCRAFFKSQLLSQSRSGHRYGRLTRCPYSQVRMKFQLMNRSFVTFCSPFHLFCHFTSLKVPFLSNNTSIKPFFIFRVGFFSNDLIPARTELCYDYGYSEGNVDGKSRKCLCGSINCRKVLY